MTLFFLVAAFVFAFAVWPQPTPGSGLWWGLAICILLAACSLAFLEVKLNHIRDYLRMLHDHQHPKGGKDDGPASHG